MTILVFYPVDNEYGWGRENFENMTDIDAFKVLWTHGGNLDARFYDMDSHYGDRGEFEQYLCDADDFETDYNDEEFDGGWWTKCLHIPSDVVKEILDSD